MNPNKPVSNPVNNTTAKLYIPKRFKTTQSVEFYTNAAYLANHKFFGTKLYTCRVEKLSIEAIRMCINEYSGVCEYVTESDAPVTGLSNEEAVIFFLFLAEAEAEEYYLISNSLTL